MRPGLSDSATHRTYRLIVAGTLRAEQKSLILSRLRNRGRLCPSADVKPRVNLLPEIAARSLLPFPGQTQRLVWRQRCLRG